MDIFNEVLFFGNKLDHSLINPNQLWYHGIPVFYNLYEQDPDQAMSVALSNTYCIPFESEGSTIFVILGYPTNYDMESYPHVIITSDAP